jgi:murein DD-endopeptidase MepM/ murein hydrolase activator NlpD
MKKFSLNSLDFKQILKSKRFLTVISSIFLITVIFFFTLTNKFYLNNSGKKNNFTEFKIESKNIYNFINNQFQQKSKKIKINIKKGENFYSNLADRGVDRKEIYKISKILQKYISLKKINTDQSLEVILENNSNNVLRLTFQLDSITSLHVYKKGKSFVAKKIEKVLYKKISLSEGIIKTSLYESAKKDKIDPGIIVEFAGIFGFEIDFQRDIRKNDIYQIVYEKFVDDDGELQKNGNIIYAYMKNNGREIALYRFVDSKGIPGYYQTNGKSIEKALMKTPINGARLSSSYGVRRHPILGYNKLHRGTDFAAPKGTPIMASGSGIIEMAKWNGAYGKYIRIKHNTVYKTAYAHLSGYARGIRSGTKVRQGQIIGYVGSTGRSTGPHLHYEVLVNGKRRNSQRLKLPSGRTLLGQDREKFEISRIKIDVMRANLIN